MPIVPAFCCAAEPDTCVRPIAAPAALTIAVRIVLSLVRRRAGRYRER